MADPIDPNNPIVNLNQPMADVNDPNSGIVNLERDRAAYQQRQARRAKVAKAFADPQFRQFSANDKIGILSKVDPDFAKFDLNDQVAIIAQKLNPRQGAPDTTIQGQAKAAGKLAVQEGLETFKTVGKLMSGAMTPGEVGDIAKSAWQAAKENRQKAIDTYEQYKKSTGGAGPGGRQLRELARAGAYRFGEFVPIIGPAAVQAGEEFRRGEYGPGALHTAELLGPEAMRGGKIGPILKETPEQLVARGKTLAESVHPGAPMDRVAAAEAVSKVGEQHVKAEKKLADYQYENNVRAPVRQAKPKIKIQMDGQGNVLKDANGKPIMQRFQAPADMYNIRGALQPLWDKMYDLVEIGKAPKPPGYDTLKSIMEGNTRWVEGISYNKGVAGLEDKLSQLKRMVRESRTSNILTNPEEATYLQIINATEDELGNALDTVKPGLKAELQTARNTVNRYHDTEYFLRRDVQKRTPSGILEPGRTFDLFVRPGDKNASLLERTARFAPQTLHTVGRTWVEGMLEKLGEEGGFASAGKLREQWRNMGPRTKQILFGPQLTRDFDELFQSALRLSPQNIGRWVAGGLGVPGAALVGYLTRSPFEAAATLAGTGIAAKTVSRWLMMPGVARALNTAIRAPYMSPLWRRSIQLLNAHSALAIQQEREQDQRISSQTSAKQMQPQAGQAAAGGKQNRPGYEQWRASLPENLRNDTDYDLRSAFNAGVQPGPEGHLPDTFKKPNHMTFSDESKYSNPKTGTVGGHWQKNEDGSWTFHASRTNLEYHSPEELQDYFDKYEKGNKLVLPETPKAYHVPAQAGEDKVNKIAQTIERVESGNRNPKSEAERNRNPGNLKPPKGVVYAGQIGIDPQGFAIFKDRESGYRALQNQVRINIRRGLTLNEFFGGQKKKGGYPGYNSQRADPQHDPKKYAQIVSDALGIDPGVPLSMAR